MLTTTPIIQLGKLKFGVPFVFEYTITNNYPIGVTLDKMVASCSACTKLSIDKKFLEPREKARMTVRFTPGSLGAQTKHIKLYAYAGDAQLPVLDLKFKATVHG